MTSKSDSNEPRFPTEEEVNQSRVVKNPSAASAHDGPADMKPKGCDHG